MRDSINDMLMAPMKNVKPKTNTEIATVRREMAKHLSDLQKFLPGYHVAERPGAYADQFISSGFTIEQVQDLCEKSKTTFEKMPSFKDMVSLIQPAKDERLNKEFQKGVSQTKKRIQEIENVKKTVTPEGWEMYMAAFRKKFIELTGTSSVPNFGFYTENYAMDCYQRGGGKSKKALEVLCRDLS